MRSHDLVVGLDVQRADVDDAGLHLAPRRELLEGVHVGHVAQSEVQRVLLDVDRLPALEHARECVLDAAERVAVAGAEAGVPRDLTVDPVDPGVQLCP